MLHGPDKTSDHLLNIGTSFARAAGLTPRHAAELDISPCSSTQRLPATLFPVRLFK